MRAQTVQHSQKQVNDANIARTAHNTQRMAELKDDPEFKEMFAEIQKGGMGALMK